MEHYFTQNPKSEYKEHKIATVVKGRKIELFSADGVFSKSKVDYGTMVLLKSLFYAHKKIDSLLDLGCGYGIIGISAHLIAGAKVTMRDINQRAVELCRKNAELNGIQADITVGDGLKGIKEKFDIIVSNPPIRAGKKAYYPWILNSIDYLSENGELWLVVQKKQGASSVIKLMESTFGNCTIIKKDAGYHILMARREDDRNI